MACPFRGSMCNCLIILDVTSCSQESLFYYILFKNDPKFNNNFQLAPDYHLNLNHNRLNTLNLGTAAQEIQSLLLRRGNITLK